MADKARKYIEIVADGSKAINALQAIEKHSKKSEESLTALQRTAKTLSGVFAGFIGVHLIKSFKSFADTALDMQVRLKATTGSAEEYGDVLDQLRLIGNKTGVSIEALGGSYSKLKTSIPGVETDKLVKSLDLVSTTLATTGANAQQTNAVFLQLTQALSSGALQGDEFRSVYENAPVLLQAWREALGKSGEALKDMSAAGDFTAESFFNLLDEINTISSAMTGLSTPAQTVTRGFNAVLNEATALFLAFEDAVPIVATLGSVLSALAANLEGVVITGAILGGVFAAKSVYAWVAAMGVANVAITTFTISVAALQASFVGLSIAAVAFLSYKWSSQINTLIDEFDDAAETIDKFGLALKRVGTIDYSSATSITNLEDVRAQYLSLADAIKSQIKQLNLLSAKFYTTAKAQAEYNNTLDSLITELNAVDLELVKINKQMVVLKNEGLDEASEGFEKVTAMLGENAKALVDAREKFRAYNISGETGLKKQQLFVKQMDATNAALKLMGKDMLTASDAQRAYAEQVGQSVIAIDKWSTALQRVQQLQQLQTQIESISAPTDVKDRLTLIREEIKLRQDLTDLQKIAKSTPGNIGQEELEGLIDRTRTYATTVESTYDTYTLEKFKKQLLSIREAMEDISVEGEKGENEGFAVIVDEAIKNAQQSADENPIRVNAVFGDNVMTSLVTEINEMREQIESDPIKIKVIPVIENVLEQTADAEGGKV